MNYFGEKSRVVGLQKMNQSPDWNRTHAHAHKLIKQQFDWSVGRSHLQCKLDTLI